MLTCSPRAAGGLLTTAAAEWSARNYAADCCWMVGDGDLVLIKFHIITNTHNIHKSYMAGAIAEVQGDWLGFAVFSWDGSFWREYLNYFSCTVFLNNLNKLFLGYIHIHKTWGFFNSNLSNINSSWIFFLIFFPFSKRFFSKSLSIWIWCCFFAKFL